MNTKLPLLFATVFAVVAIYGIVQFLEAQKTERRFVTIVVARVQIRTGDTITRDVLTTRNIDATAFLDGAMITSDEEGDFTNYRSLMNFNPGDPILKPGLTLERRTKQPLAPEVPAGLRGISLPVTSTASVSNLIETGDRIDVLIRVQVPKVEEREVNISGLQGQAGNFNIPTQMETQEAVVVYMLQDATVLATGDKVIGHQLRRQYADEFELGYDSITIAVAPEEAPVLVLAMAMNNDNPFVLLLRNPADDGMLAEPIVANYRALLDTARLTNLLQNRRQRQVEIIQGGQRR